jgi:hypothetical protein
MYNSSRTCLSHYQCHGGIFLSTFIEEMKKRRGEEIISKNMMSKSREVNNTKKQRGFFKQCTDTSYGAGVGLTAGITKKRKITDSAKARGKKDY